MKNRFMCILLIDDDDTTNILNTLTIQDLEVCHSILSFTDSEEAFEYLSKKPTYTPGVVLVDYYLPSSTAIEVATQFKKISPSIKTVILTAYIGHSQSKEIVEGVNVDDLIFKPLTEDKLIESFRKMGLL